MDSFLKIVRSNVLAQAVVSIIIGVLLMVWPGITIITVLYLVGIVFAAMAISSATTYFKVPQTEERPAGVLATAIFFGVLALVVFLFPQAIAGFFSVILGAILVLCGAVNMVRSAGLKKYGDSSWGITFAISLVIAVGGLVILANPFETTSMFVFVLGAIFLVNGIMDLVIQHISKKLLPPSR